MAMKSRAPEPMTSRNPMIYMGFYKEHDQNLSFMQRLLVQ